MRVEVNWEILVSWRPRRDAFRREWSAVLNAAMGPNECKERKASFGLGNRGLLKRMAAVNKGWENDARPVGSTVTYEELGRHL